MKNISFSPIFRPWVFSFALAMIAGLLLLSISQQAINEFAASESRVEDSYSLIGRLEHLSSAVERIETARRAYSISQNPRHLETFHKAYKEIDADFRMLQKLTTNHPEQQQRLAVLKDSVNSLTKMADTYIRAAPMSITDSVDALTQAKVYIDQVRELINGLTENERQHLAQLNIISGNNLRSLKMWMLISALAFIATLFLAFIQSYREISQRRKAELYWLKSQQQNLATVHQLSLMGEMTSLLQSCTTISESMDVISRFAPRLIPADSGVLYLFSESRNLVEMSAQWGSEPCSELVFEPQECWALRRGEPHVVDDRVQSLACGHLHLSANVYSLCVPIVAQGNVLGIMHLEDHDRKALAETDLALANNLANQIALAMASIKLRETLRNLSVRDSLTGLFNRRYLEESLPRELASAHRKKRPLALVMLDIDYFKNFNDMFGHEAGDLLLREVGALLDRKLRSSDIACRFGGEEFVLVFTETQPEIVVQLVNQLREGVAAMHLNYFGQSLGQVTASFGLAFFPEHGTIMAELIRSADQALYKAKEAGRNCVEIAQKGSFPSSGKNRKTASDEQDSSAAA